MSQPADLDPGMSATPRHGYRGNRAESSLKQGAPAGLAIAISRESGARGGTIARLVGEKLSWQVYDQEVLEYMAQNPVIRQSTAEGLSPACMDWLQRRTHELEELCGLGLTTDVRRLVEVILSLAAQGEAVLIGRGAGCILPAETTLNVRIVAPLQDRIAYMGQWLRLTREEAAERVRQRDERRADFVTKQLRRSPTDVHQYDMILNSSLLGEEGCAELITRAANMRWSQISAGDPPLKSDEWQVASGEG
jgi:cytidylate kinase